MFTFLFILAIVVLVLSVGPVRLAIFIVEGITVLFFFGVILMAVACFV